MAKPHRRAWSTEERTRHRWHLAVALGVAATGLLSAGAELSAVERPRLLTVTLWAAVAVVGCGVGIAEGLGGLRDRRARAKAVRQQHQAERAAIINMERGGPHRLEHGTHFTGRRAALRDLAGWIANASNAETAVFVVTGGPGSGKSALLGRLLALASRQADANAPEERDLRRALNARGGVDVFVDARYKPVDKVAAELADRAGVEASSGDELADALARTRRPWLLVVDGLDEAKRPEQLVRDLIRPLARQGVLAGIRLLVATRPNLLSLLTTARQLDLDDPTYFSEVDLTEYVRRLLLEHRPTARSPYLEDPQAAARVAAAVARRASPSFLIAQLVARSLVQGPLVDVIPPGWEAPATVDEAMDDYLGRFGDDEPRVRGLLLPLATRRVKDSPRTSCGWHWHERFGRVGKTNRT